MAHPALIKYVFLESLGEELVDAEDVSVRELSCSLDLAFKGWSRISALASLRTLKGIIND